MSRFLKMVETWSDFPEGVKVRVLGPGEPIEGRCVDAFRADRLVADGLAEDYSVPDPEEAAEEAAPVNRKAKKKSKKKATKKKAGSKK